MNQNTAEEKADYLHRNFQKLESCIKNDIDSGASTMLHSIRKRLNELIGIRRYLSENNEITLAQSQDFEQYEKELKTKIHALLQERLIWHSRLMDEHLTNDIKTTSLIVANVYNDIIDDGVIFLKELQ